MVRVLPCKECGKEYEAQRSDSIRCPDCRRNRRVDYWRFEERHSHPCPDCGQPCGRRAKRCHSCDTRHRNGLRVMEDSPSWRGGRHLRKRDGYIEIRISAKTSVLEHRLVWGKANGPIPKGWHVHHLNGIKHDNRLENLVAMSPSDHHRNHHEPWERRIRELEALIELNGAG